MRSAAALLALMALLLPGFARASAAPRRLQIPASAADTLALTLEDAVARALATGEEARIARAAVLEAHGRVHEALSGALPQINSSLTYNRKLESIFEGVSRDTIFGPLFKNSSFAAANAWTAELTGSWLIYSSGKTAAALRGAHAVYSSAAAHRQESEAQIVYGVKRAYYEAAFQQRLIAIAESGLGQARAHLAQVAQYRGQGMRSEYDLLRAQVDAANQEPPVVAARQGTELAMLDLARRVNLPLERPLRLSTALDFDGAGVPVPDEPLLDAEHRHAIEAAEADVQANRQLVRVQRGRNWPDLTLQSTLQHQAFPSDPFPTRAMFHRNWDVSLKLELPLFTGFRVSGLVDQARAGLQRAEAERDRLKRQTAVDLAAARAELARSLAVLAARRETVRQADRAHVLADVRYRNGLSTQLETSDARLQLQTAQVNEIQAARDYRVALAGLELVLGRPVKLQNQPLDAATSWAAPEGSKP